MIDYNAVCKENKEKCVKTPIFHCDKLSIKLLENSLTKSIGCIIVVLNSTTNKMTWFYC